MTSEIKPDENFPRQTASKRKVKIDQLLDKALEETFPGSDPVSLSQPSKSVADKRGS